MVDVLVFWYFLFFFKQKTAYEMRISDWSSDVCSSDLYAVAVVIVGALMMLYVLFGGMRATTWVQIIKAVLLLGGASFMALMVLAHMGFSLEALFARAVEVKTQR